MTPHCHINHKIEIPNHIHLPSSSTSLDAYIELTIDNYQAGMPPTHVRQNYIIPLQNLVEFQTKKIITYSPLSLSIFSTYIPPRP